METLLNTFGPIVVIGRNYSSTVDVSSENVDTGFFFFGGTDFDLVTFIIDSTFKQRMLMYVLICAPTFTRDVM